MNDNDKNFHKLDLKLQEKLLKLNCSHLPECPCECSVLARSALSCRRCQSPGSCMGRKSFALHSHLDFLCAENVWLKVVDGKSLQKLTIRCPKGAARTLWLRYCHITVFALYGAGIKARRFIDCHLGLHHLRQKNIIRCHVIDRVVHVAVANVVHSFDFHLALSLAVIHRSLLAERRAVAHFTSC